MQENYACIFQLTILLSEDCYICYASSFSFEINEKDIYLFNNLNEGIISSTSLNAKHEVKEIRTSRDTVKTNKKIIVQNTTFFSFSFQSCVAPPTLFAGFFAVGGKHFFFLTIA